VERGKNRIVKKNGIFPKKSFSSGFGQKIPKMFGEILNKKAKKKK